MKGLVTIKGLDALKLDEPAKQTNLPPVTVTPRPEKSQVVHRPVYKPVNRQAALIIAPNRNWLTQPAPDVSKPDELKRQLDRVTAKLKLAQNQIGELGAKLGNSFKARAELRAELAKAKAQLARAVKQIEDLKSDNATLCRKLDMVEVFRK